MASLKLCISAKLIDLYEVNSCLWDTKSAEYHNKIARTNALEIICRDLGISVSAENIACLKLKLKHLRTSFSKELRLKRQSERSGAGTEDVYIPKWVHFDQCRFLEPHCSTRPGKNNLDDTTVESEAGETLNLKEPETFAGPSYVLTLSEDIVALTEDSTTASSSPSPCSTSRVEKPSNSSGQPKTTPKKRPAADNDTTAATETLTAARELLSGIAQSKRQRTSQGPFYFYAMNLASQLERLDPLAALACQRDIDNLLHGYLYQSLNSKTD